ncbi:hypothetical protein [Burkholderia plantarii]|uniref:hypothetical protein n=1 Tax=Burkholderia plantarii TaxID=41899 RepID=UPI00130ED8D4|nr:hypothetical protein [Burkholderia plantarii]
MESGWPVFCIHPSAAAADNAFRKVSMRDRAIGAARLGRFAGSGRCCLDGIRIDS